jgi:hypothetical protein
LHLARFPQAEMDYFRRNPFDREHMMQLETLVEMCFFENDRVVLDNGVEVVLDAEACYWWDV